MKRKLPKQWLAERSTRCFGTQQETNEGRKMNTKKDATNRNSFPFEESARRGNVDFIFCGIHTFKFIDHSNQSGKDLTPPFPAGGMEACGPKQIGVQPGTGGPEAGSSK